MFQCLLYISVKENGRKNSNDPICTIFFRIWNIDDECWSLSIPQGHSDILFIYGSVSIESNLHINHKTLLHIFFSLVMYIFLCVDKNQNISGKGQTAI